MIRKEDNMTNLFNMTKNDLEEYFVSKNEKWIQAHIKKQLAFNEAHPIPSEDELDMLKEKAKAILPQKVDYFSKIMGVTPTKISINTAKTRYGSCSSSGRINFSCRLMSFDERAIDYVVVHELAHLVEMNHSPAFYEVVRAVLPDYKERKKLLRA
jgi:predicted metal-dependent hydrolase